MGVSREDVRRVAELARLELSDLEIDQFTRDLDRILGHMEALEIEALEIEQEAWSSDARTPAAGPAGDDADLGRAGLRGDEPGADRLSDDPATFAPDFQDGFFTVPRLASHDPSAG